MRRRRSVVDFPTASITAHIMPTPQNYIMDMNTGPFSDWFAWIKIEVNCWNSFSKCKHVPTNVHEIFRARWKMQFGQMEG